MTHQPAALHGRTAEQSVIGALIAAARAGRSGALVLRGEPGIGKTAQLDYAAGAAGAAGPQVAPVRVIRGGSVEAGAELPFVGLHLLLGPALDRLPALPQQQQQAARRGALGLDPGRPGADRPGGLLPRGPRGAVAAD